MATACRATRGIPHRHPAVLVARASRSAWLAVGLSTALSAQAPKSDTVAPNPGCAACRIELTRIATLGNPGDSLMPHGDFLIVSRNGRGQFLVGPSTGYGLLVYDSAGRPRRHIGRRGPGPGEFTQHDFGQVIVRFLDGTKRKVRALILVGRPGRGKTHLAIAIA